MLEVMGDHTNGHFEMINRHKSIRDNIIPAFLRAHLYTILEQTTLLPVWNAGRPAALDVKYGGEEWFCPVSC